MLGLSSVQRRLPRAMQGREFALFVVIALSVQLADQMIVVAVGWQVYDINHRAFDLGLLGLLEFAPVFLLALPGGALVDRVSRRLVLGVSTLLLVGVAAALIAVSLSGARVLWPFLVLAAATGVSTALLFPVTRALPPALVPRELLSSALALRSVATQTATVGGPALGGLLFALSPEAAYGTALGLFVVATGCVVAMHPVIAIEPVAIRPATTVRELLGGIHFIRATPVLLGAILLDLFAVLFGGAVALLPVFAQSILHTGPVGLGFLRSAPAFGAVIPAVMLVRRPLPTRAGPTLIAVVAAFGASMVVFGFSRWLPLSLAALVVSGAVDMVSVNIRTTTATLITPDYVRGRVGAVEAVFVGASNQLGAFESGTAAALLGAVPAVVGGGALTIALALAWTGLFPDLSALGSMEELVPRAEPNAEEALGAL